jgi:hypothetical protein
MPADVMRRHHGVKGYTLSVQRALGHGGYWRRATQDTDPELVGKGILVSSLAVSLSREEVYMSEHLSFLGKGTARGQSWSPIGFGKTDRPR